MNFRDLHEEVSKILDEEEENSNHKRLIKDFKTEICNILGKLIFKRDIDLLMSYSGIFPVCCLLLLSKTVF